jgi:hypothetical protein
MALFGVLIAGFCAESARFWARPMHCLTAGMSPAATNLPPVVIIAKSRETIDSLQEYFGRTGVVSHAVRSFDGLKAAAPSGTTVVLFPDEFDAEIVRQSISSLRSSTPASLIIIVTGSPQRLGASLDPDPRSRQPVVLPKPAFGWAILDAVRDQADV